MKYRWDELRKDLKAETRSKLVGAAVTILLSGISGLGLYLLKRYLPPEAHDPKTHEITQSSIWGWLQQYPHMHPKRAIFYGVVFAFIAGIFVALIRLITAMIVYFSKLSDSFRLRKIIGLSAFWPNAATTVDANSAWDKTGAYVLDNGNPILFVLGATGLATFGPGSPLYSNIEKFRGEVRILLMSPTSQYLRARALSLGIGEADYRRDIGKAIRQINKWKNENRNIDYRTYDSVPNWKLILTKEVAWVQYYRVAAHVDDTPVFHFYATDDGNGLYHLFLAEFHRIWKLCEP